MDSAELRRRLERGEDLHTEFKKWPVNPDSAAAAIVAFANTDGGQLILGIRDDRSITGVPDPDRAAQWVDDVARNNCEPPVTVVQEVLMEPNGTVLSVSVPKGDLRPHQTRSGLCYIRTSSGRRRASREELLRLFQASESMYYDETRLIGLSVDELDPVAVDRFADATGRAGLGLERDQLLRAWRLVRDDHPTVAGVLLFGRDPQRHLPTAQINAARVPGTDIANDPLDRKDLGGRLLDLIDQAERFLRLHLPRPHVIQGFAPEPRPELPETALREAVVNAVVHRDYTISAPIRLLIFDDRVEIRSPGRPPNGVDVDAMRAGAHVVRNPHLYARISDAGVGSGVPRLVRAVREAVGLEPVIEVHNVEVAVIVPRPTR